MRIGFFGGSFNPPTKAHMNLANKALKLCNLDKLIFVPMGDFYEKEHLARGIDRFNMLKIACSVYGEKCFEVSDLELKIQKKLHTIDAFRLIERKYPNDERYFIMGADNFVKLTKWKDGRELVNKYNYIVLERGDINLSDYIEKNKELQNCNLDIIQNDEYRINSSTEFRNLFNDNKKQNIIQQEVYEYIIKNNIYREK